MNINQPDSASPSVAALAQFGTAGVVGDDRPAAMPPVIDVLRYHMPPGHLHEIFTAQTCDMACGVAFAQILATEFLIPSVTPVPIAGTGTGGNHHHARQAPFFWVRVAGRVNHPVLHPPGMAEMGFSLDNYYQVHAENPLAALRAAADIARCNGVGAVFVQIAGNPAILDLTATRRLALAAEKTGAPVILLRTDAAVMPSAAYSRWQISSTPSAALPANAPGLPTIAAELLRHRKLMGGISGRLEWDAYRRVMREVAAGEATETNHNSQPIRQSNPQDATRTTISGSISALPARQPDIARWQSAA
jgi:protein ImuA